MYVKNVSPIRKQPLLEAHGADPLYQIWWEDDEHFVARRPEPMKSFTNFSRLTLKPDSTKRLHTHPDIEQVYLVTRGGGVVQVGNERREVKAGDAVFLPANVPHGFFNTTEKLTLIYLFGVKI